MKRIINRFYHNKKGVISIEFAIIFPFLLALFLLTLELSRLMLIGSSLDLLSTEISRKSAITESILDNNYSYKQAFQTQLNNELPLWGGLISVDNVVVRVSFCETVEDVISRQCNENVTVGDHIILFNLTYQYNVMFIGLLSGLTNSTLNKDIVVYREFNN